MRQVVYEGMLRLPFRIGGGATAVAGVVGSVWPDKVKSTIGDHMSAEHIQLAGAVALAVALVYFVVLWLLKPSGLNAPAVVGGPSQITHGPQSPSIGTVNGPVYLGPPTPAATQATKSPYGAGALPSGSPTWQPVTKPKPDMFLGEVVVRVMERRGDRPSSEADQKAYDRAINLDIMDAVNVEGFTVWGRHGNHPIAKIFARDLVRAKLDYRLGTLKAFGEYHSNIYRDIKFSSLQIDAYWPATPGGTA